MYCYYLNVKSKIVVTSVRLFWFFFWVGLYKSRMIGGGRYSVLYSLWFFEKDVNFVVYLHFNGWFIYLFFIWVIPATCVALFCQEHNYLEEVIGVWCWEDVQWWIDRYLKIEGWGGVERVRFWAYLWVLVSSKFRKSFATMAPWNWFCRFSLSYCLK